MAHLARATALLLVLASLAACSGTWSGLKKDTGDNLQTAGQAVDKAGKKVEQSAQ